MSLVEYWKILFDFNSEWVRNTMTEGLITGSSTIRMWLYNNILILLLRGCWEPTVIFQGTFFDWDNKFTKKQPEVAIRRSILPWIFFFSAFFAIIKVYKTKDYTVASVLNSSYWWSFAAVCLPLKRFFFFHAISVWHTDISLRFFSGNNS